MIGKYIILIFLVLFTKNCRGNDILGCGGFVKSHVNLDFSKIEIGLYTKEGSLKERTECAPTNGYYFLPLYEKGHYVLKVHPPPGWSFEPSQVDLHVDGSTDSCSTGQDINFAFNGFGITGKVITAGQTEGPKGVAVQLIDDTGEKRDTVTGVGGDFHFTPVIPGKYTLKASHPKWKLEPSQAVVQVKEGNTVLPVGVLAVKGYEVKGSVVSDGVHPLRGMYVLLYSKDEKKLKFRVEGCNTALLRDVHENPICHSVTDEEGEFSFGLVPAGEYLLLALEKSPVKPWLSYNLRKVDLSIAVAHESLYIKKAFQVTGFQVLGSVLTASSGVGMEGVKVELYTDPNQRSKITTTTTTNAAGQFKLPNIRLGTHWLAFSHDNAEFSDYRVDITPDGPPRQPVAVPAKWRVCGSLSPPDQRTVTITSDTDGKTADTGSIKATSTGGQWCVFLPPGRYTARVDVTDEEHQSGLRFYPVSQPVAVGRTPVTGIMFSQLKAQLSGKVVCKAPACKNLPVTMRTLAPNGGYTGQPVTIKAKDGKYAFKDVPPGSVEVSVPSSALCWRDSAHNAAVAKETDTAPDFVHTGYAVRLHSHHDIEVEYTHGTKKGTLKVPAGISSHCVEDAGKYVLTPRGCHQFQPVQMEVTVNGEDVETVLIVAVSHAATIRVLSPDPVEDLVLTVSGDGGTKRVGPLPALQQPQGGYAYDHTLYLKDGEIQIVSASSSGLLFSPAAPQQVLGQGGCQPSALTLRARRAATVAGQLVPPVEGVLITLTADDVTLTQTTTADGTYHFGPLDASKQYRVTAEKESYTFGERDAAGNMAAHKLAEITVLLVDEADGTPLQGALVSVSGGTYRRNVVSGPGGAPRFGALAPAQYYVKPHMKEYRFNPPHTLLAVEEGKEHRVTLKGVRVAWSCLGSVVSLAGAPWAGVIVRAEPVSDTVADSRCAIEEATTEDNGSFRIRGLIPACVYRLSLKASGPASPRLPAAPPTVEVKDKKDIEGIRLIAIQPHQVTDIHVLVKASNLDHYKTLRLTLSAAANQRSSLYATKLDPIGFTAERNPGLLYVLPRLPADNSTYILQLESTLSKATHHFEEEIHYFEADGTFKSFDIVFAPKVKTSEQELRQTSLLVVPLLGLLAIAWSQRNHLFNAATAFAVRTQQKTARPRPEVLDRASIDHIVSAVNAAGKKVSKKKQQ